MEREEIVVAAKLSVAGGRPFLVAGLKRALPMRWKFTWIGVFLGLEVEVFELLGGALFGPWQGLVVHDAIC